MLQIEGGHQQFFYKKMFLHALTIVENDIIDEI